ncbi:MAG TPA: PIG-L deacetylase family protein [Candidatus Limnocylindria bacterium]|nr:PIG-L deacetylase family protein [Candidatus Limnocylindria bacterium]
MGRRLAARTVAILALGCSLAMSKPSPAGAPAPITLGPGDRVLVLAPHPDDESLGCGGVLHAAARAGIPAHVVFLTNGDANELSFLVWERRPVLTPAGTLAMGRRRAEEARAAARALGLPDSATIFLGYPDAGTMAMWTGAWGARPPHESLLTRATAVPYETALRPGAPYKPESVVQDLQTVLRRVRPTRLFVSHPDDAHPDHRAWYLYAMAALWETPDVPPPAVHTYLVHHPHWPAPAADPRHAPLDPPADLASRSVWRHHPLTPADQDAKHAALEAHATQIAYSRSFLLRFVRADEPFAESAPLRLERPDAAADLTGRVAPESPDPRVEATQAARDAFVGVAWRRLERRGDALTATLELSRRLLPGTRAVLYFFGARPDHPFAQMPKLRVTVTALGHRVSDQDAALTAKDVVVERKGRQLAVIVPLARLDAPRRVLVGAETVVAEVVVHPAGWRTIELGAWSRNR